MQWREEDRQGQTGTDRDGSMFLASSASRAQHARQAGSKAGLHTAAAAAPQASRDMTCMRGGGDDDDDARNMMATCMHDRERDTLAAT